MDVRLLHFANKGNMYFENLTAFVGLEGPGWTILKKPNLESFNLQNRRGSFKEFRKTVKFWGPGLRMF